MMIELLAAVSILTVALLPVAYSFAYERKLARSLYYKAIAMEVVDGEFELLRAGGWRAFQPGSHTLKPSGWAATNLPAGNLELTLSQGTLRLEWKPAITMRGGSVRRECQLP